MKLGLIGKNIGNSLSPVIHNAALRKCGIDGHYKLLPTTPDELPERLKKCFDDGYQGLNITTPYKAQALSLVSLHSPLVDTIHSTNTLVRTENGWYAESTDGEGVRFALSKWKKLNKNGQVVILGSGGFARAATNVLLIDGWKVYISSRNPPGLEWRLLKEHNEKKLEFCDWMDRFDYAFTANLVINATPLGSDQIGSPLPLNREYTKDFYYLDAIYSPRKTLLLSHLAKNNTTRQNGFNILLGQAASSFRIWTGMDFPKSLYSQWKEFS